MKSKWYEVDVKTFWVIAFTLSIIEFFLGINKDFSWMETIKNTALIFVKLGFIYVILLTINYWKEKKR